MRHPRSCENTQKRNECLTQKQRNIFYQLIYRNMKEISLAIIAVMTEIEWVAKNMTVWSGSNQYKWVSDKDVRLAMRDSMVKNWLSILPIWVQSKVQIDRWEEDDSYKPGIKKTKQSCFTEVETKYLLLHTSGESIEVSWYGQGVDSQDKWAGKATTYALKNALLNMFLVPTGVDTEDTHSDDIPVPQNARNSSKPSLTEKPWYDTFDADVEKMRAMVASWERTPQEILDNLKKKYKVNTKVSEAILALF